MRIGPLPASPVIIPISDLRQDTAGVVRLAGASGEPVYVTQRGRTTVVVLSRLSYEGLRRDLEILSRVVVGDLDISPSEGLTLAEILARGERALAEEGHRGSEVRATAERRLAAEERAAMRPASTPTLEQFLASEGLGHLVPRSTAAQDSADAVDEVADGPSVWYRSVSDE